MNTQRAWPGVAILDNNIYVMGGFDGINRLQSVEVYNVDQDSWTFIAPMSVWSSGMFSRSFIAVLKRNLFKTRSSINNLYIMRMPTLPNSIDDLSQVSLLPFRNYRASAFICFSPLDLFLIFLDKFFEMIPA